MSSWKSTRAFRKVQNAIEDVEGWLTDSEARYLYSLACCGPGDGAIVEIGSWKGKSTIVLAMGTEAAGREKVYAVDNHKGGPDQEGSPSRDPPSLHPWPATHSPRGNKEMDKISP